MTETDLTIYVLNTPNTCAGCGRAVAEVYADNADAARAGRGLCAKCATPVTLGVEEIPATPAARKLADEAGIDLYDVAAMFPTYAQIGVAQVRGYLQSVEKEL